MIRTAHLLAGALLLASCRGRDDDRGPSTGADCFELPAATCPADTPVIGVEGGFGVQQASFTWAEPPSSCVGFSDGRLRVGPPIYARRPADLNSLAVTVDGGSAPTGFAYVGRDGVPILNFEDDEWDEAPFFHSPAQPAGTLVFPISPTTAPDTGDCYAFVPAAFLPNRGPDIVGERATLHVASRRESAGRTLEINLVLVDQAEIYQDEIDATIIAMERFFGAAGITVGDVWLYELDMGWDSVIDVDGDEASELRAIPLEDAADNSVNVYLFDDAFESGLYGIAAGIPGPVAVQGTAGSGVIVIIGTHLLADRETLDTNELGGTIAHEIGHQLGLFHTTEADGLEFDILSDTPECPSSFDADRDGEVSAEECRERDGGHVLFWTSASFPQQTWSAQQRDVLARSPVMKR
jgi:hypothetical protein